MIEIIQECDSSFNKPNSKSVKLPAGDDLGQDCDLAKHTHREIVRMAVVEALEGIESPRYQSSKIELNEIE